MIEVGRAWEWQGVAGGGFRVATDSGMPAGQWGELLRGVRILRAKSGISQDSGLNSEERVIWGWLGVDGDGVR